MPFTTTDSHPSGASAQRVERQSLFGLEAIAAYLGVSYKTVLRYKKNQGLPVRKLCGRWYAEQGELDRWRFSVLHKG